MANPVDMLASAGPRDYAQGLKILLADGGVDGVMVIHPPPPMITAAEVAGAMILQVKITVKPVVVALMGREPIAHAARLFRHSRVPDYRFPERAASALQVLVTRAGELAANGCQELMVAELDLSQAEQLLSQAEVREDGFLDTQKSAELAAIAGIATPAGQVCRHAEEAISIAENHGFLALLKIADPSVTHKSDAGGVRLNLHSR